MIRSCTYTHTKMHISLNLLLPILLLLTTSAHAQIAGSDSADLYTRVNTYKTQAVSITNTPFDTVLNSIISSLLGWFEPISPSALTSSWVSTNTPTMSLSVQGSLLENVDMGSDFISKPLKYVHLSGDTTLQFTTSSILSSTGATYTFVTYPTSTENEQVLLQVTGTGGKFIRLTQLPTNRLRVNVNGNNFDTNVVDFTGSGMNIWTLIQDPFSFTSSNRIRIYRNGVYVSFVTSPTPAQNDLPSGSVTGVFGSNYQGLFGDIIVHGKVFTNAEIAVILNYLKQRYFCAPGYKRQTSSVTLFSGKTVTIPSCSACSIGSYQPNFGAANCVTCSDMTTTIATASILASTCLCSPGYGYNANTQTCNVCPQNTYKNNTANTDCSSCPINGYTRSTGARFVWECLCDGGYAFRSASCVPCPVDMYRPSTSLRQECDTCPPGSSTNGQTGSTTCQCKPSYYGTALITGCTPCPLDTSKSSWGNTVTCQSCNITSSRTIAVGSDKCECGPGYTLVNDANTCSACPSNTEKLTIRDFQPCVRIQSSVTSAFDCEIGYTFDSAKGYCSPCPLGMYKSNAGIGECIRCPEGFTTRTLGCTDESFCRIPIESTTSVSNTATATSLSSTTTVEPIDTILPSIIVAVFVVMMSFISLTGHIYFSQQRRKREQIAKAKLAAKRASNVHSGKEKEKFVDGNSYPGVAGVTTSAASAMTVGVNGNGSGNKRGSNVLLVNNQTIDVRI